MLLPNRHGSSNSYRYGFNGMEKDDEIKGEGNSINYEARMQDTRVGRFLSIDPLTSKFPMLTPYQFASNNPITNVDLDGIEGVWYRVVKIDETTGKKIPIKRVVEVDVHVAVNSEGTCGAYTPNEKETIFLENSIKYNKNGYKDDDGLTVEFLFSYIEFNPESYDFVPYAQDLLNQKVKTLYTDLYTGNPFESIKGVAIWKDDKLKANGNQLFTRIRINPKRAPYDIGHAESHEIAHFLLTGEGSTVEAKENDDDHTYLGFMKYVVTTKDEETGKTSSTKPDNTLSKKAFKKIIKSVPRIEDKIEGKSENKTE